MVIKIYRFNYILLIHDNYLLTINYLFMETNLLTLVIHNKTPNEW